MCPIYCKSWETSKSSKLLVLLGKPAVWGTSTLEKHMFKLIIRRCWCTMFINPDQTRGEAWWSITVIGGQNHVWCKIGKRLIKCRWRICWRVELVGRLWKKWRAANRKAHTLKSQNRCGRWIMINTYFPHWECRLQLCTHWFPNTLVGASGCGACLAFIFHISLAFIFHSMASFKWSILKLHKSCKSPSQKLAEVLLIPENHLRRVAKVGVLDLKIDLNGNNSSNPMKVDDRFMDGFRHRNHGSTCSKGTSCSCGKPNFRKQSGGWYG